MGMGRNGLQLLGCTSDGRTSFLVLHPECSLGHETQTRLVKNPAKSKGARTRTCLAVHPLELRPHDVVQLVLDDVELHHGVGSESHGGPEGEARVVGTPVLSSSTFRLLAFRKLFSRHR